MEDMLDFANVYPSMLNLITVGLMATIFLVTMKWLTHKYAIPGLSDVFAFA